MTLNSYIKSRTWKIKTFDHDTKSRFSKVTSMALVIAVKTARKAVSRPQERPVALNTNVDEAKVVLLVLPLHLRSVPNQNHQISRANNPQRILRGCWTTTTFYERWKAVKEHQCQNPPMTTGLRLTLPVAGGSSSWYMEKAARCTAIECTLMASRSALVIVLRSRIWPLMYRYRYGTGKRDVNSSIQPLIFHESHSIKPWCM